MTIEPFSEQIVEAILRGSASADKLPPELAKVAHIVHAAQAPASMSELSAEHAVLDAFRSSAIGTGSNLNPGGKRPMLSKMLSAKAAIAAGAIALTGGAAAAMSGALVSFHHAPSTSSVTAQQNSTSTHGAPKTTLTIPPGTNQGLASGASLFGLCKAYTNITTNPGTSSGSSGSQTPTSSALTSTAFQQLSALATANKYATVADLCATVKKPSSQGAANSSAGKAHSQKPSSTPQLGDTSSTPSGATSDGTPSQVPPASLPAQAGGGKKG